MNTLKLPEGTPMLDMDSPTFATDLANAIGLQPDEKLEIVTPQFERTDGMQVPVLVDFNDWENLHKKDEATLRALGFGVWDETEKGKHWLFPKEWYDIIPDGHPITDISGNQEEFKRGETDDDYRFGCLAFGFIQEPQPVLPNAKVSGPPPTTGDDMSTIVLAAGPLDVVVGHCAPANCMDCPESSVIPDPDPDDWFCDDDCAVVCRRTRNEDRKPTSRHMADRSEYRAVTVACRPYNRRREADRPEWCPMVPNACGEPGGTNNSGANGA